MTSYKKRAEKIRAEILKGVEKHPSDIVDVVEKKFGVTRTTVHRHINTLIKNQELVKSGSKKGTKYFLAKGLNREFVFKVENHPEEHQVWDKDVAPMFAGISKNVEEICYYGFGEIFNNAVDHSEGTTIFVGIKIDNEKIEFSIADDGIGVFKKIQDYLKLEDIRESILHLIKGKLTTAPEYHSGEGIFFSSRAFDQFTIFSNGLMYVKNNTLKDWLVESRKNPSKKNTMVIMEIKKNSKRNLQEVFEKYQNPETKAFDKTHILVQLSQMGGERFVSRSQAKRIVLGLDKFHHITLDFQGVQSVGQAFVDEVFRVFQNKHPQVKIEYIHANDAIEFMITRSLSTAQLNSGATNSGAT